ncbi:sensor histidine kinase [Nocardia sp. CA-290969]|uniref:sensor histidine kinase n=1 Tax=Nocardia sp. CA-290969 TaxID=3239986 RepID=UPI003D90C055
MMRETRASAESPDHVVLRHVRSNQIQTTVLLLIAPALTFVFEPFEPVAVLGAAAVLAAFIALHVAATGMIGGPWAQSPRIPAWAAVAVAIPAAVAAFHFTEYGWAWLLLPGTAAADLVFAYRSAKPLPWALAVGGCTAALLFVSLVGQEGADSAWRSGLGALGLVVVACYLESAGPLLWQRTVEAEQATTRLAQARERLRISDDLHDILGRALEVVAFKTELAARLISFRPDRAQHELEQVQQVAREAMIEVRNLVNESKPVSLDGEIHAAVRLLESAGVDCTVTSGSHEFPGDLDDVLGRVVRESVTNILRHSAAAVCSLTVSRSVDAVTLLIVNDGLRTRTAAGNGTGLDSLRRRLQEFGGELTTAVDQGRFHLRVRVPQAAPVEQASLFR